MIRRDFCYVAGLATGSALVTSLARAVDAFGMPNEDNHLQIATDAAFEPSDIVLDVSGYVKLADVDTDLNAGQTYYWRQTLFLNSQHVLVYHGRLLGGQLWELIELYNSKLIPFIQEVKEEPVPPLELGVICHIPLGNPRKAKTIEIDADDLGDHLGHGDHLGACDGTEGDEVDGERKGRGKKSGKNGEEIPGNYELGQNYPNPFTTFTTIPFALPEAARARLTMYNLLGQQVGTTIDTELAAGRHEVIWNASSLPSGTYVMVLNAGTFSQTRQIVLTK